MSEEYEQHSEDQDETEQDDEPTYTEYQREEEPPPAPPHRHDEPPTHVESKREEREYASVKKAVDPVILDKDKDVEDEEEEEYVDRVKIRSYSSMILFFPTFLVSLIFGVTQLLLNHYRNPSLDDITKNSGYMNILGTIFLIIFTLNLILIAFDFNGARAIIIALILVILIGGFFILNAFYKFLENIHITMRAYMSTQVYFAIAILLFLIIILTIIAAHTNYYIVEGNELLHRKGLLGGIERYPASDMSIIKEYPDIIEYGLFKFGTLILTPPRSTKSIILKNVPQIDKKEKMINEILSRIKVDVN